MKQTKPVNNPDSSEHKQQKRNSPVHLLAGIFLTPLIFLTLEKNVSLL